MAGSDVAHVGGDGGSGQCMVYGVENGKVGVEEQLDWSAIIWAEHFWLKNSCRNGPRFR